MLTRTRPTVKLLAALGFLALGGCGASRANSSPASIAAVTSLPVAAIPAATSPAAAPTSPATPAAVAPSTPFTGYVQQIYPTGDFILLDGQVTYTIVMLPTTFVVNLLGRQIPRQAIVVSGSVQVTGTLADSKVNAQTVLVPTRKDGRDP
jgi:hypothetical protein